MSPCSSARVASFLRKYQSSLDSQPVQVHFASTTPDSPCRHFPVLKASEQHLMPCKAGKSCDGVTFIGFAVAACHHVACLQNTTLHPSQRKPLHTWHMHTRLTHYTHYASVQPPVVVLAFYYSFLCNACTYGKHMALITLHQSMLHRDLFSDGRCERIHISRSHDFTQPYLHCFPITWSRPPLTPQI